MSERDDCPAEYSKDYDEGYDFGLSGVGEDWPYFSYKRDEHYMADFWWRSGLFDGYKEYLKDVPTT